MVLKFFFVISAVAIRPHGFFLDMCTRLSRVLFSRKGNFIRSAVERSILGLARLKRARSPFEST